MKKRRSYQVYQKEGYKDKKVEAVGSQNHPRRAEGPHQPAIPTSCDNQEIKPHVMLTEVNTFAT
jgi:hypothetical protein